MTRPTYITTADLPERHRENARRQLAEQPDRVPILGAGRVAGAVQAKVGTTGPSEIERLMEDILAEVPFDMAKVERQAMLVPDRKYACDFFVRPFRIVVECEGLNVGKNAAHGAHQGIEQVGRDCAKSNLHQIHGFMFLRFTGRQIRDKKADIINMLRDAMKTQRQRAYIDSLLNIEGNKWAELRLTAERELFI